jgi:hypothetical protein
MLTADVGSAFVWNQAIHRVFPRRERQKRQAARDILGMSSKGILGE